MSGIDFFEQSKRGRGRVKHSILKYYLGGYFAVVGQTYPRLVYVEGCAGSGQYTTTTGEVEEGSPIVAYKTAVDHQRYNEFGQIDLIFIEAEKIESENLAKNLLVVQNNYPNASKVRTIVRCGIFQDVIEEILGENEFVPMLVFVDPYGIKAVPMELIKRLVDRPKTELFINVMFSSVNRWYRNPQINKALNELLGEKNSKWKISVFNDKTPKTEDFIKYYVSKLKKPGNYHHIFAMRDKRNRNIYQLVFFTQHFNGVRIMKRAMHNNSQESDRFIYSEWLEEKIKLEIEPHGLMSQTEIEADIIARILEHFEGQEVSGKQIDIFVWCKTPYIFNSKISFKKSSCPLTQYVATKAGAFDEFIFKFPSI